MTPPSSHYLRHRFIFSQPPHPPPRFARPNHHLRLPQDGTAMVVVGIDLYIFISNFHITDKIMREQLVADRFFFVISLLYGLLSPTLCSLTSFGLKILLGFILR
ncbi:hypothetical protein HanXRQr2_Chr16g0760931 [Helianthus annuus]|uniref:Uncharacterized protein n=1 Tax=Helianthus annuus TaxID=4232 RepID=A0A9K3DSV1_HELAN|nr:hypothetical protein HanXRQr2_Chr16g0760931 [Helianthus annuus]KAJ0822193.1 hypothetical protein HanPSC8_Chr16g0729131 [Helianthus annuus]